MGDINRLRLIIDLALVTRLKLRISLFHCGWLGRPAWSRQSCI